MLINSEEMFEDATLTMNEVFAQIGLRAYRDSELKNLGVVNKTPPGKEWCRIVRARLSSKKRWRRIDVHEISSYF